MTSRGYALRDLRAWAFPRGEANHVVGIETTVVSGRRFGSAPAATAMMVERNGLRQM